MSSAIFWGASFLTSRSSAQWFSSGSSELRRSSWKRTRRIDVLFLRCLLVFTAFCTAGSMRASIPIELESWPQRESFAASPRSTRQDAGELTSAGTSNEPSALSERSYLEDVLDAAVGKRDSDSLPPASPTREWPSWSRAPLRNTGPATTSEEDSPK